MSLANEGLHVQFPHISTLPVGFLAAAGVPNAKRALGPLTVGILALLMSLPQVACPMLGVYLHRRCSMLDARLMPALRIEYGNLGRCQDVPCMVTARCPLGKLSVGLLTLAQVPKAQCPTARLVNVELTVGIACEV